MFYTMKKIDTILTIIALVIVLLPKQANAGWITFGMAMSAYERAERAEKTLECLTNYNEQRCVEYCIKDQRVYWPYVGAVEINTCTRSLAKNNVKRFIGQNWLSEKVSNEELLSYLSKLGIFVQ